MKRSFSILKIKEKWYKIVRETVSSYGGGLMTFSNTTEITENEAKKYELRSHSNKSK